jgi:hypothetical protein
MCHNTGAWFFPTALELTKKKGTEIQIRQLLDFDNTSKKCITKSSQIHNTTPNPWRSYTHPDYLIEN